MALAPGVRLGAYEVLGLIGAGGMGEVYKARDTRLDRIVAIKTLPESFAADRRHEERFRREARAVAALNHPHICALHDIGESSNAEAEGASVGPVQFLVMEFLEGQTLGERLLRGPLAPSEVVTCAIEIADALDHAHRCGLIHRDLKPANVMLTRGGAKLLDFGLSKQSQPDLVALSTVSGGSPLTAEGTLLGTYPYMAPEQLTGREADARSDIFTFGAMVYEMVTGRRAFEGSTAATVIGAILHTDPPPISVLQPLAPPGLDRIVSRCLAKDPDERWQSTKDLTEELRWLARSSTGATSSALSLRRRKTWWLVTAGTMLVFGIVALQWQRANYAVRNSKATHQQITFAGNVQKAALSPDGKTVAYFTQDPDAIRLFVRDLAGDRPLQVWTAARTVVITLTWMPNGSELIFSGRHEGSGTFDVWVVPRLGGTARHLDEGDPFVAVAPDGMRLALARQNIPGFAIVPIYHGETEKITLPGIRWVTGLEWSARTNQLVVVTSTLDNESVVWSIRADGQQQRRLHVARWPVRAMCLSPAADVYYAFVGQELWRVPLTPSAVPQTLVSGLRFSENGPGSCNVSADGTRLIYLGGFSYANLWRLDLGEGHPQATPLTSGTAVYWAPRISPDGAWVASSSSGHTLRVPISGGEPSTLVEGWNAAWSPDGNRLAFLSNRGGTPKVWVGDAAGERPMEIKESGPTFAWLPNGHIALQKPDLQDYGILDLATWHEETLVKDPSAGWVFQPRFSPKGDQVALLWNRKGRGQGLWTLSWPAREERFLANTLRPDGWSPDGNWIYAHEQGDRQIVRVSSATGTIEPVGTFPIGQIGRDDCDVAPDGRAIVCALIESKSDAWVIDHFDPQIPSVPH